MALFIWDTFQIIVSESALTRLLNKKKWTKKIVHFHKKERWSLLMFLASTTCRRAEPGAQGELGATIVGMGWESANLLGWIGCKWSLCSSQIWLGTCRQAATWIQLPEALRTLVYSSCILYRWFHCMGDHSGFIYDGIVWQFCMWEGSSIVQSIPWPKVSNCHG